MSRQVYLLALALALVAAFCVSSSTAAPAPAGFAFARFFNDANCTTSMNNDLVYENTTILPGACQPGHGGRPYVIPRACSVEEGLIFDIYTDSDCSETSHVMSYNQSIGTCISAGTNSIALWCNLTSVQNISGTAKFISTPADVQVAPSTINGSSPSNPCPIEGCGEAYYTSYVYEDENCTGNITDAYLTTTLAQSSGAVVQGVFDVGTCLLTAQGISDRVNLTARFECDENFLTYTGYIGDCQDSSTYGIVRFPLNTCLMSAAGQWYKSVCPRATSPISSPVEDPVEAPETIPSTPTQGPNPISPIVPPSGDANAISSVSAMILVVVAVLAIVMA